MCTEYLASSTGTRKCLHSGLAEPADRGKEPGELGAQDGSLQEQADVGEC